MSNMYELIPNIPSGGNFDKYRKNASFDWKKLKIYVEGEEICLFKLRMFKILRLERTQIDSNDQLQQSYQRYRQSLQLMPFLEDHFNFTANSLQKFEVLSTIDPEVAMKRFLSIEAGFTMLQLREKNNSYKEILDIIKNIHGCIALTEVAHGSNLRNLKTTAIYETSTDSFILNTPSIEAWKCWIGNLGSTATHAMVLAQLYTPDGKCHGIHWFFVPIRNPRTMKPYPGILVGHMGKKIGLNNVDNGFMAFTNYRISRNALMNGYGNVTSEGVYEAKISNFNKRFAITAKQLNITRFGVIHLSVVLLTKGIVIGVRYATVRRQFGPDSQTTETPLLEYPLHQLRLMPYLCTAFITRICVFLFFDDYTQWEHLLLQKKVKITDDKEKGMHLIIITLKSFITWIAKEGLQEIREACGGHGYLKASGLGDLMNHSEALVTLEGDNNVLQIQMSRILFSAYKSHQQGKTIDIGYGLLNFLDITNNPNKLCNNTIQNLMTPEGILGAYEVVMCHLLSKIDSELVASMGQGISMYDSFNLLQGFLGKDLANVFSEWLIIRKYLHQLTVQPPPSDCSNILTNMGLLFGLWRIKTHLLHLCQANYTQIDSNTDVINRKINELCAIIKKDAISLTDAIAPPDEFLYSVLGCSDGEVYKRIVSSFLYDGQHLTRPSWWKEMCFQPELTSNL